MKNDDYFQKEGCRTKECFLMFSNTNNRSISNIDRIPDRYKRKDYIIDKIVIKKKNVEQ